MMSTKLDSFFSFLAKKSANILHNNCSQDNVLSWKFCHLGKYFITVQSLTVLKNNYLFHSKETRNKSGRSR